MGANLVRSSRPRRARWDDRLLGLTPPARAVGSTSPLEGLKAEVAIVLDMAGLDMALLCVTTSRGLKKTVVYSRGPILNR